MERAEAQPTGSTTGEISGLAGATRRMMTHTQHGASHLGQMVGAMAADAFEFDLLALNAADLPWFQRKSAISHSTWPLQQTYRYSGSGDDDVDRQRVREVEQTGAALENVFALPDDVPAFCKISDRAQVQTALGRRYDRIVYRYG